MAELTEPPPGRTELTGLWPGCADDVGFAGEGCAELTAVAVGFTNVPGEGFAELTAVAVG